MNLEVIPDGCTLSGPERSGRINQIRELVANANTIDRTSGRLMIAFDRPHLPEVRSCGPINTIEEAFALAKELGLDPGSGAGASRRVHDRHRFEPDRPVANAGHLPAGAPRSR